MASGFPDFKGRIPAGGGLPSVGGGQSLKPSHISGLATGIDKATIRSGRGYKVSNQSSGGTTLKIDDLGKTYPWECREIRGSLMVTVGNCWGMGLAERRKNAYPYKSKYFDDDNKFWSARPVLIDIEDVDFTTTDSVKDDDRLILPIKVGYYYIEWTVYEGESGTSELTSELVGTEQFVMKFSTTPPTENTNYYLLCHIDNELNVFQGVRSDIFHSLDNYFKHPFQIYITKYEDSLYAEVAAGTINNIEVLYSDGTDLGDEDGGFLLGSIKELSPQTLYIWVNVPTSQGDLYPDPSNGIFVSSGGTPPSSGGSDGVVVIGKVVCKIHGNGTQVTARPQNFVTGSLWTERFKLGNKPPEYWFSRI